MNWRWIITTLIFNLWLGAYPLWAQNPPAGASEISTADLVTGDFSLDDVEELPLPTEEEGGVQVEGKNYLPKPKYQPPVKTVQPAAEPTPVVPAPVVPAPVVPIPEAPAVVTPQPTVPAPSVPAPVVPVPTVPAPVESAPELAVPEVPAAPADLDSVPEVATPNEPAATDAPSSEAAAGGAQVAVMPARLGAEGAPDIYTIDKGDNLWDICQRFFGDPFLWPKLWAMNQYITNPHLIFPGDQLRFIMGSATQAPSLQLARQGESIQSEELAKAPGAAEGPVVKETLEPTQDFKSEKLETSAVADTGNSRAIELRNYSFLTPKQFNSVGKITHSGEEKFMLATGDTVYMKFKDMNNIHVGDQFHVMQTMKTVQHPSKSKTLGYLVHYKARIRVTKAEKRVITGVIEDSWDMSSRDDVLVPYESLIKRVVPKESDKKIAGLLVEHGNEQYLISQRDIAFVNLGKANGLEVGDTLKVVQDGDGAYGEVPGLPDVVIGQLTVIEMFDNLSVVFVNWSKKSLQAGDRVTTKL